MQNLQPTTATATGQGSALSRDRCSFHGGKESESLLAGTADMSLIPEIENQAFCVNVDHLTNYVITTMVSPVHPGDHRFSFQCRIHGDANSSKLLSLQNANIVKEPGEDSVRNFILEFRLDHLTYLGNVKSIEIVPDNISVNWKLEKLMIEDKQLYRSWYFNCGRRLDDTEGAVIRIFPENSVAVGAKASRRRSSIIFQLPLEENKMLDLPEQSFRVESNPIVAASHENGGPSEDMLMLRNIQRTKMVFLIQYYTKDSHWLYISGSSLELGEWDPSRALRMNMVSTSEGSWRGDWKLVLEVEMMSIIEYRFFVKDELSQRVIWEEGDIRKLDPSTAVASRQEPMGGPHIDCREIVIRDLWKTPIRSSRYGAATKTTGVVSENSASYATPKQAKPAASLPCLSDHINISNESYFVPTPDTRIQVGSTEESHIPRSKKRNSIGSLSPSLNTNDIERLERALSAARRVALDRQQEVAALQVRHRGEKEISDAEIASIRTILQETTRKLEEAEGHVLELEMRLHTLEDQYQQQEESLGRFRICKAPKIAVCVGTDDIELMAVCENSRSKEQEAQEMEKAQLILSLQLQASDLDQIKESFGAQLTQCKRIVAEYQQAGDSLCEALVERDAARAEVDLANTRWRGEFQERRRIFNELQNLRGNIRVFCRVRPPRPGQENLAVAFVKPDVNNVTSQLSLAGKTYEYDQVFRPEHGQEFVYNGVSELITSVLDGYNVCILAYGQTGSGKTYTMSGSQENRGVNYRAVQELFAITEKREADFSTTIKLCMVEIYNEQLRDLVSEGSKLEIKLGPDGVYAAGATWVEAFNVDQVWDVMEAGMRSRSQAGTAMNERSSRSHLVFSICVEIVNRTDSTKSQGKLNLVDLAGSERLDRSHATGDRLKEAQHINKSLSALGDVFAALLNKSSHVPYRNSKLTYLLQDSLGGDSKTLMFVNISPSEVDTSESTSSLMFASRVAKVELGKASKKGDSAEVTRLSKALKDQAEELASLQAQLETVEKTQGSLKQQLSQALLDQAASEKKELMAQGKANELQTLVSQQEAQIRELQNRASARNAAEKDSINTIAVLQAEIAKLTREKSNLARCLEDKQAQENAIAGTVSKLEAEVEHYKLLCSSKPFAPQTISLAAKKRLNDDVGGDTRFMPRLPHNESSFQPKITIAVDVEPELDMDCSFTNPAPVSRVKTDEMSKLRQPLSDCTRREESERNVTPITIIPFTQDAKQGSNAENDAAKSKRSVRFAAVVENQAKPLEHTKQAFAIIQEAMPPSRKSLGGNETRNSVNMFSGSLSSYPSSANTFRKPLNSGIVTTMGAGPKRIQYAFGKRIDLPTSAEESRQYAPPPTGNSLKPARRVIRDPGKP